MIVRKWIEKILTNRLKSSGFSNYFAPLVSKKILEDVIKNKRTTVKQKIWALSRGFYSDLISFYGLTGSNYHEYLSPLRYNWLHPINGSFGKWIDDKLTTKYILQPFSDFLPKYYYHIYKGEILKLSDCPTSFGNNVEDVINLIKDEKSLAAKPVAGSYGRGFTKLSFNGKFFQINNQDSTEEQVIELLSKWKISKGKGYLITEYLYSHQDLRRIWDESPNPLRIMVIKEKDHLPKIINSYIIFGTKNTGTIENSNGIHCPVDLDTGHYSDGKLDLDYIAEECKFHPDTNILIEGKIPHWMLLKEKLIEICSYIQQIQFMGFDIVITDDGFKIMEINSHQGIRGFQYYYPLMKEGLTKRYFSNLIEEKNNKHAKSWLFYG